MKCFKNPFNKKKAIMKGFLEAFAGEVLQKAFQNTKPFKKPFKIRNLLNRFGSCGSLQFVFPGGSVRAVRCNLFFWAVRIISVRIIWYYSV